MGKIFYPKMRAALIGSLPLESHKEATRLVLEYTPEIPLWVQLPVYPAEGMLEQFLPGFPGVCKKDGKLFINSADDSFEEKVTGFYEAYLAILEDPSLLGDSIFALDTMSAAGFFEFMKQAEHVSDKMVAVKGQITGPFTFATGIVDEKGRALFYDDQLRDIAVKIIAMKARWQARRLSELGRPVIIFFDEPALAAFGSSAYISISKDDVSACFAEVFDAVHAEGGLAGVHVCANAQWDIVLDSSADIVSFDSYSFFDKFILYGSHIKRFVEQEKIIAWGIVPTGDKEHIAKESVESITGLWRDQAARVEELGVDRKTIERLSLITPSCGTGSLDIKSAMKVLELTAGVSRALRDNNNSQRSGVLNG